ncbi:hypothetical protein H4R19_003174 [Coemansia spiralis]|nr:hypothetical protein H4R19_003174 [Coemansia spiralis]
MLTAEGKESLADNVAMSTVVPAMAHTHMAELQAEPVRTHEEDETCLFSTKAKLFELDDDNWKERGGGHLKVNRHNDSSRRCRLVMRTDQTFRLILNVPLFPAMKLSHERRFVRFTCLNTDTMAPATFVLRFASDAMATDAHRAISDAIPPPDAAPKDKGKGADTAPASGSEDDDEDYANDDDDESSSSDEEEEEEEDKEEDDADEEDNEAAEVANHDDDGASDNVEASDDDEAASSSDKESA